MNTKGVERPLLGVSLVIFAESILVITGILIREMGSDIAVAQLVFLRNALGLLFMLALLGFQRDISLVTHRLGLHFTRAFLGVSAMSCLYYGWTHLPLGTAAVLKQTAPLFMPLLALWFLRESINPILRWTLPIGFLGVALIVQPSDTSIQLALLIGLAGAILGASAKIAIRKMRDTEPSRRIVLYFSLFASLLSAPFAFGAWVSLETWQWLGVTAISGLSTLAQLAMTRAYHNAPAGFLGPFTYSSVFIATFLGWALWEERLDLLTLGGMCLILAGGVLTARAKSA